MNNRRPGGRGAAEFAPGQRPKLGMNTIKRLLSYLSAYKLRLIIVLVCLVVSALATVLGNSFIQTLVDDYITPLLAVKAQGGQPDFGGLARAILAIAALFAVGVIATYAYNRLMITVSQGVLKNVRDNMFDHMQTLPVRFFDANTHGDIMSHYTNDIDTMRQMLGQSLPQVVSGIVSIVAVFIAMLLKSWQLTIFVVLSVGGMALITKNIAGNSGKYFVKQQESLGKINGYIEEMMHGQRVVKVFCHERKAEERFDELNAELCGNASNANKFANILMPIMANLGHAQYVLIAIIGGAIAIISEARTGVAAITLGTIIAFLQLSKGFTNPVSQMAQQLNSIVMAMAGAERIFKLIDEPSEVDDGYVTLVNAVRKPDGSLCESDKRTGLWAWKHPHGDGTLTYTEVKGDVRMFDVDFGYVEDKIVLHDVTLYAEPGQKVAFVGATGAGKTTITNLINRFYDIADGKIRYDGININKIKKDDLRHSLGIVLQDTNLFTGTVRDNIRYGKLDATDEEIERAAKLANAHDFITRLPNGYDTMLDGDASSLSQGQRQLISIARAAVEDPPVMILDEATSSIDTRTEAIVQKGMDGLMHGRTVFVIAHRLSTVKNSDVIMVLEHGRIIERGSHEQLIAEKGKYYQLYTGAFELE